MENTNYISINIYNLLDNINYLRNKYNYLYYIFDVSNNAYNHGIYLINYLQNIDYLYVNNFNDLLLIRKYNSSIKTIYSGEINYNNIYDLIINNAILVIKDFSILKEISIKDNLNIILFIDKYNGIYNKNTILDIIDLSNQNTKINILGLICNITKENYEEFKYLTSPLKNLKLICLNSELDKNKIKKSNAIKLDYSIYGLNIKKEPLKPVLSIQAKIVKITKNMKKKKEQYIALITLGSKNGIFQNTKKVLINNKLYNILLITEEYTLIEVDKKITTNDYVTLDNLTYLNNLPIIYHYPEKIYNYL